MNKLIENLKKRKKSLERVEKLSKEKELFVICKLDFKVKYIYKNFGKVSPTIFLY